MAKSKIRNIFILEISRLLTTDIGSRAKPVTLEETESGCIVSTSHKVGKRGYLLFKRDGKIVKGHRLVYEAYNGPIPEGLLICHKCDNRGCLNPDHFFGGTNADNLKDMAEKGRAHKPFGNIWNRGEKSGNAKLTDEQASSIREKYHNGGYSQRKLGREYGIDQARISSIVNGRSYRPEWERCK